MKFAQSPSLRALITLVTFIYIMTLAIMVYLVLWSTGQAERHIHGATLSHEQLAIALGIKADIGHHLITELSAIVGPDKQQSNLPEPDKTENTLQQLVKKIDEQLKLARTEDEAEQEKREFATAKTIASHYSRMLENIESERRLSRTLDSGSIARAFVTNVIKRDYQTLNGIVENIVTDEREEAAGLTTELNELRQSLFTTTIIALVLVTLISITGAIAIYKALMQPLRRLTEGSQALATGKLSHRIAPSGPPELHGLARSFNAMVEKLAVQQKLLIKTNEGLEDTIARRTHEIEEKANKISSIDNTRRLFFAKIGHELRTPLTVMLGETDVALGRKDASAPIYREALQHIAANGEYLKRRIADFMTIARSEDGQITMQTAPCELHEIIKDTVKNARAYARSNNIRLTTDITCGPAVVAGDESWLHQGILAIIDNAIKFSPEGGEVIVKLIPSADKAIIRLTDEGPGVPGSDLPKLFEPYFQSNSGRTMGGSGLGLSIARWVTDKHSGRIEATNRNQVGLAIHIELPLYNNHPKP